MPNETFLFRFTHCEILFSAILIVLLWAQKRNSAKVVWISDKTKVHFLLGFRAAAFLLLLLVTLAPFQGETCQISSLSLTLTLNEKKVRRYFFISLAKQDFQGSSLMTSLLRLETDFLRLQLTAKFSLLWVSKHFKSPTEKKWKEETISSESHKMENFCCFS